MTDKGPIAPSGGQRARASALAASGHISAARHTAAWYVVATSAGLGRRPQKSRLFGWPLVVFRDGAGAAGVLLDRCPHRNVPLSEGRVIDGALQCPYHGWRFGSDGACVEVPGLVRAAGRDADAGSAARAATAHAVVERDGLVWAWGVAGATPTCEPPTPPRLGARYSEVRRRVVFPGTLHATAENALDVPHTAFLHRGLFRGAGARNEIEARLTRDARSVTATYHGEPRPAGLVARLLSPSGGEVAHFDRFELPSTAIVDYRIGDENHFRVTTYLTPLDDLHTEATAIIAFRLRVPHALVLPFLAPLAMRIFRQDAVVLARQSEVITRFGGERFVSTEIDILGAQIARLLDRAAAGRVEGGDGADAGGEGDAGWTRTIKLLV